MTPRWRWVMHALSCRRRMGILSAELLLALLSFALCVEVVWLLRTLSRVDDGDFSGGEGNQELHDKAPYAWPQWLGPRRDGTSPETGLLDTWPKDGPPQLWSVALGPGYSSMAIAKGRLVTMAYDSGRETVVCLNADTGKHIWRRSYPARYAGIDRRFNQ